MSAKPSPSATIRGPARKPKKTAMLLAQRIVAEIADGGLEPDTPLPPERDMLEQYQVARGSLREALRFLEIQGVITIKTGPRGGPMVSRPGALHLARTMALMLQLDGAAFRSVLEARMVLEPTLARNAAERVSDEDAQELLDSVERLRGHLDDLPAFLAENDHFHATIAEAASNPVFSLVVSSLTWISDGTPLGVSYGEGTRRAVCRQHERIAQAIAAHDGDAAAAAMTDHVRQFADYLEQNYRAVMDARLRWDLLE